ncbi:MAG: toll/interleukin-1 receptor domain-containing protein [Acidobacteriia bacterium]|nr:toll/interleukin-1 receptor domain-containing protein [Terriglobia bacterium]
MDLRDYNYKVPQLLKKLRTLLRRDPWLDIAFQRSVILKRKGQPCQHALTRIDFVRGNGDIVQETQHDYQQIRFISERLAPETVLARLKRLQELRFTAGRTSIKVPQSPGLSDDYQPRDNEYSEWPGTHFDVSLESSIYLSQDTLADSVLQTYESEYEAAREFMSLSNLSSHDGRLGHLLIFVPNYNARIKGLTLSGRILSIMIEASGAFSDLVLDIHYSHERRNKRASLPVNSLTEVIEFEFDPTILNIWLKSRKGYWLDYHKETPDWSVGANRVLPKSSPNRAHTTGFAPFDDVALSGPIFDTSGNLILDKWAQKQTQESSALDSGMISGPTFDVFVSHASEDKDYVEPLVSALEKAGIRVWFDKTVLGWGDDLRSAIDRGLTNCRYGVVVFSAAFLRKKKWTEYELNALFAREEVGKNRILPIWHNVTRNDLLNYSPALADRLAKISANESYADIVNSLLGMLGRSQPLGEQIELSATTPGQAKSSLLKPNPVAYARYETNGENALSAESYVRPSQEKIGWFTFDNSFGEEQHGTREEISMRFALFDKSLTIKGYIRKQYGNSSGDLAFSL